MLVQTIIIFSVIVERNADVLLNACKDIGLAVNTGKTRCMEIGRHRGVIANEHINFKILTGKPTGRSLWGGLGVDGRIILEWILKK